MSDSDSFIDEVREEIRKDRLYRYVRKYGWIAIAVVVLVVGGAAYFEFEEARKQRAAEERGDRIIAALDIEDGLERAGDLSDFVAEAGPARPVVTLRAAAEYVAAGDADAAAGLLDALANDPDAGHVYRDLARLKLVMLTGSSMDSDARLAALDALAQPGAPFRPLAMEQRAALQLERGNTEEAIAELMRLLDEPGVTDVLVLRTRQAITALGGDLGVGGLRFGVSGE